MDEFIDHFFSSSSWSDASATERSSLVSNGPAQTTRILSNSIGPHEGAEKYSHTSLISPSHTTDNLAAIPGTCLLIGDDSNSGFNRGLHPREARPKQEGSKRAARPLLGLVDTNLKSGYLGLQLDTSSTSQGTLNYTSPKLLPVLGGLAKSTHAPPDCSDEISTNNPSAFQGSLRDAQGLPSIPHSWSPPSYVIYPSHAAVMGQDKPQAFGLQGEHVDADATVPGNRFLDDDRFLHMENLTRPVFGQDELHQNCLSSFDAGAHVTLTATTSLPSQLELSQMNEEKHYANPSPIAQPQPELSTAGGGCNGAIKPRVRARRGQATDPHSIAERLRREKIADRMKNLQEVVPNSNKTDKASMLDEIIDYVKFLQLQVKVLSMSRLGGAGAVVPLVTTDSKTEGFCGPVVSPSDGQEAIHSEVAPLGLENNVAFEKEVAKLMDSNVTTAMQYLQSKGLCLMPIALASAISGWKPPSFSSSHGFGVHQLSSSSDSSEILGKDSTVAAAATKP